MKYKTIKKININNQSKLRDKIDLSSPNYHLEI